jgi:1-acyl-sn-glycerol-3-phosphate acyltransferase
MAICKTLWFVKLRGKDNIPNDDGGIVVVSNHPTYLDPVWISIPFRKNLRFMAWDHAFGWPVIGRLIYYLGAFPVKLNSGVTKTAIVESLRSLRGGAALVIFPEGEREFADGRMLEFKTGAVHIALNAGVPILPVSISGGSAVWPQGRRFPRLFRKVTVTYHPAMHLTERPVDTGLDEYLAMLNDRLVSVIASEM